MPFLSESGLGSPSLGLSSGSGLLGLAHLFVLTDWPVPCLGLSSWLQKQQFCGFVPFPAPRTSASFLEPAGAKQPSPHRACGAAFQAPHRAPGEVHLGGCSLWTAFALLRPRPCELGSRRAGSFLWESLSKQSLCTEVSRAVGWSHTRTRSSGRQSQVCSGRPPRTVLDDGNEWNGLAAWPGS